MLKHYDKGLSPSALQRKYRLTYEQGYELAKMIKQLKEVDTLLMAISTHTCFPDEDMKEQVGTVYRLSSQAYELTQKIMKKFSKIQEM